MELRTQAIQSKLVQYDKLLKSAQSEKIWRWEGEVGEGTSARTVPVKILRNHHVIHRKHRKRAEDALDLDLGRHPVFSRYGTEGYSEVYFHCECHFSSAYKFSNTDMSEHCSLVTCCMFTITDEIHFNKFWII